MKEKKAGLRTWQIATLTVAAILILGAVAYIVFENLYLNRRAAEIPQVPAVSEEAKAKKTIAVLPFDDLSPEKDQEYFVDGLSEEILNSLTQIPGLTVIAKTSSFSFKGKDKTIPEIASILGVDHILEGSVRKAGNALRITAQLVKAVDGSHLWSKIYDKEFKVEEMFSVQEDIANNVADKLKLTLEAFNLVGGTDNVEAYELYLIAKGQMPYPSVAIMKSALESIDAAITLDPKFALAWALKAYLHSYLSLNGPVANAAVERDASLRAAQKAHELEPNLAEGYTVLGSIQSSRGNFIEAESYYNKARELKNEISWVTYDIAHITAVGYFEKAQKVFEEMVRNDPLNQEHRAFYLFSFGLLGDVQRAEEEYEKGRASFGEQWSWGNALITHLRLGAKNSVSRDEIVLSGSICDTAKEYLDSPTEGLAELHRFYNNDDLTSRDFLNISIWAAYFGDPEFAIDAMEEVLKIHASDAFFFWLPVMHDVRHLPRFKEVIREIGLVDYWNKFGWPDICRPLDNGDFECD